MADSLVHIEGGACWCDDSTRREKALDALYPDRCQLSSGPGTPSTGERNCVLVAGHTKGCRGSKERPGEPCHYCGAPTDPQAAGPGCPDCWKPITIADFKGLMAEHGIETTLRIEPAPERGQHG